jgi:hypothetical protein
MSTLIATNFGDGTNTIPSIYVTGGSAKSTINFNGEGTVAIRESMNVSSLTDNGTGTYAVAFTTAMSNGDFTVGSAVKANSHTDGRTSASIWASTASNMDVRNQGYSAGLRDTDHVRVIVMGDLA